MQILLGKNGELLKCSDKEWKTQQGGLQQFARWRFSKQEMVFTERKTDVSDRHA